jgi:hypothetical protein
MPSRWQSAVFIGLEVLLQVWGDWRFGARVAMVGFGCPGARPGLDRIELIIPGEINGRTRSNHVHS